MRANRGRFLPAQSCQRHLDPIACAQQRYSIAQIVKGKFFVRAVGDVAGIGVSARIGGHALHHGADCQAQKRKDRPHLLGIAGGQVVVDSNHVNRDACQRSGAGGQGGRQGLAFAGCHLDQFALQQCPARHQLRPVVALPNASRCDLPDQREAHGCVLRSQAFNSQRPSKLCAARRQCGIGGRSELGREAIRQRHNVLQALGRIANPMPNRNNHRIEQILRGPVVPSRLCLGSLRIGAPRANCSMFEAAKEVKH